LIAPGRTRSTNVVDSSRWIEFLVGAAGAESFLPVLAERALLLIPTISITEVFRWVQRRVGEQAALAAAAVMRGGRVINLDEPLAISAAQLGAQHKLPLADSIIYATAQTHGALLWTQDAHFDGLPGVRFIPKQRGS
jgi:predicted nucleic acid-binding protein